MPKATTTDTGLTIKVKYFLPEGERTELGKIAQGDWIDLYAAEDVNLTQFEYHEVLLGVAMELPAGYEANMAPRSSTFKKWGIVQTNGVAVIDESYKGDDDQWKMPVIALRTTSIKKGDKIAQFRINKKMDTVAFKTVDKLGNDNRGGFGTTGTKAVTTETTTTEEA